MVNTDPARTARVEINIPGQPLRSARGRVITAAPMGARPEFGRPDTLVPAALEAIRVRRGVLSLVAPAKAVITVELD